MKHQLTPEQVDAIEGIIARRMANTGETREQACLHILKALGFFFDDPARLRGAAEYQQKFLDSRSAGR
jgi:hypothetical protein